MRRDHERVRETLDVYRRISDNNDRSLDQKRIDGKEQKHGCITGLKHMR